MAVNPNLKAWSLRRVAASIPAEYTESDPLDMANKWPLIEALSTEWWNLPTEEQRRVIANAMRSTMISPRLNFKWNTILYQLIANIPGEESDPEVFVNAAKRAKRMWDAQGQTDLFAGHEDIFPIEEILPGKMQYGILGNLRKLANIGPYIEDIRKAALSDLAQNGGGKIFRDQVVAMKIPGVGPKVASFSWLMLNPTGSNLATLDVWMMKDLKQQVESPRNYDHYQSLEEELDRQRQQQYPETPLGPYQWGRWDAIRTPGYHQDHTGLKPIDWTPYTQIDFAPYQQKDKPREPLFPKIRHHVNQMPLFSHWIPSWTVWD